MATSWYNLRHYGAQSLSGHRLSTAEQPMMRLAEDLSEVLSAVHQHRNCVVVRMRSLKRTVRRGPQGRVVPARGLICFAGEYVQVCWIDLRLLLHELEENAAYLCSLECFNDQR